MIDFAKDLAYKAGKIIRTNFSLGMKKQWKADGTPLTLTDKIVNELVINKITKKFPTHSILGEEKKLMKKNSSFTWVCDPVDGTIPFSHGYPTFTFSLALVKDGKAILGVVYDVMLERLFWAERGGGAFLNDKRIFVNKHNSLDNQLINLDADFSSFYGKFQEKVFKKNVFVSVLYSATYGGILVACGEYIAEAYGSNKPWDGAAISVIVEEAGGKVTDIYGNDQKYDREINGFIASNGLVHKEIIEIIGEKNGK